MTDASWRLLTASSIRIMKFQIFCFLLNQYGKDLSLQKQVYKPQRWSGQMIEIWEMALEKPRDDKLICQDSQEVAGRFNQFFTNIGSELAKHLPNTNLQCTEYSAASDSRNFNREANFFPIQMTVGRSCPFFETLM